MNNMLLHEINICRAGTSEKSPMTPKLGQFEAKLPACPSGIDSSDYVSAIKRTNRHCERLFQGLCTSPCDLGIDGKTYHVEVDHIQPRSKGGGHGIGNIRLLCASANRRKSAGIDPQYTKPTFFDQPVNVVRLREGQKMKGYDLVVGSYREIFDRQPSHLFLHFMLICAVVGAGKTVTATVVLCAINNVINSTSPGRWRVKRAVWFVHHSDLVKSLAAELEEELTGHEILGNAPRVGIIRGHADWSIHQNCDIVVACPQSMWEASGRKLSTEEKQEILSRFDAIVVDECQFAVDKYLELARLAPHAFKFAITATPMDDKGVMLPQVEQDADERRKGKYEDVFRLFSVYGYESAVYSGYLKKLAKLGDGIGKHYFPMPGGDSKNIDKGVEVDGERNSTVRHNSSRQKAVISKALELANLPKDYDGHVMCRVDSIKKCKTIADSLSQDLPDLARTLSLHGDGWNATAIYSGSSEGLGDPGFSWMRAKKRKGRCDKKSARILLAVNLGQFGVNQPCCNVIAYIDPSYSIIELVQRIGRAIRRTGYVPADDNVKIVWNSAFDPDGRFENKLSFAIEYLRNMESLVTSAFIPLSIEDTQEQRIAAPAESLIMPTSLRLRASEMIGRSLSVGAVPDPIEISRSLWPERKEIGEDYVNAVESLISSLSDTQGKSKDRQFGIPQVLETQVIVKTEEPPEEYLESEILEWLEVNDFPGKLEAVKRARDGDNVTLSMVSAFIKQQRAGCYSPLTECYPVVDVLGIRARAPRRYELGYPQTYFDMQPLSYLRKLKDVIKNSMLKDAAGDPKHLNKMGELCRRKLRVAVSVVFGLPDMKAQTYSAFEDQLSNALCAPQVESKIMDMAKAMVIRDMPDVFPGLNYLYSQQLSQISQKVDESKHAKA